MTARATRAPWRRGRSRTVVSALVAVAVAGLWLLSAPTVSAGLTDPLRNSSAPSLFVAGVPYAQPALPGNSRTALRAPVTARHLGTTSGGSATSCPPALPHRTATATNVNPTDHLCPAVLHPATGPRAPPGLS